MVSERLLSSKSPFFVSTECEDFQIERKFKRAATQAKTCSSSTVDAVLKAAVSDSRLHTNKLIKLNIT